MRVPWNEPVVVKRVLDMGAQTILFPYVENKEQAKEAVMTTRYPPKGIRGVMSSARMNRYGTVIDYYNQCEKETCVIVQCESITAVKNIPSICEIEGIDAIFVGPSDLSASIGKIGQVSDPEVQYLIQEALDLSRRSNKPCGILTSNMEYAKRYKNAGFTFVGINSDSNLLARSAEKLLREFDTK